ncbi:hypothetical protein EVAR_38324_1 [Eumeta japonica]|uniref:Uncharacterized protein n=1 Tax=Eumeta variegata TaxID=151549 RepID=A0A4C1X5W5_EUMVA|nr:hypothetical protein EVAR_38324_1 [Eumeta japonica]
MVKMKGGTRIEFRTRILADKNKDEKRDRHHERHMSTIHFYIHEIDNKSDVMERSLRQKEQRVTSVTMGGQYQRNSLIRLDSSEKRRRKRGSTPLTSVRSPEAVVHSVRSPRRALRARQRGSPHATPLRNGRATNYAGAVAA